MLVLPPFQFANCTDNLTGSPNATTPGTSFTAGANNADGAAVSVLAAVAHDIHLLLVGIGGISATAADCACLLDILIDPAGGSSWSNLIDDLVCGFTPGPLAGSNAISQWYYFPLYIKSGASIGVQARTAHTANLTFGRVIMYAIGNPNRPDMWWCGVKTESLGINASTSRGTIITPGGSGSYSAWANIGSTTAARYGALQLGINGSDASASNAGFYFQVGYGSAVMPGHGTLYLSMSSTEAAQKSGLEIPWCDVPAGTQMQARATGNSVTPEPYDVAIYGVY